MEPDRRRATSARATSTARAGREIHDHLFLGANTGLADHPGPTRRRRAIHARFLAGQEGPRRPLRPPRRRRDRRRRCSARSGPRCPTLRPGRPYLVEVVVRTLGLGHPFSQGTVDSNEIWVELIARAGDRVDRPLGRDRRRTGRSTRSRTSSTSTCSTATATGSTAATRRTSSSRSTTSRSPRAPGRSSTSGSTCPRASTGPITLEAKVNYRKFDRTYMDYIFGKGKGPELPVVVMASDARQAAGRGGAEGDERALADQGRPGSAGTTTASACCSKGATRGARRAS